jgi:3-phosphoshikimate 1-carboxyvinyltransferase
MNLKNLAYKISPTKVDLEINIPSSKSYANRSLILAAMLGNEFKITNLSPSSDVENLIKSLLKLGIKITRTKHEIVFHNSFPLCEQKSLHPIELHTGDGGTTNRFLIALCSLGSNEYHFFPSEKMTERPIDDLLEPLIKLSVKIEKGQRNCWVKIRGPINSPEKSIVVNCEKSTQFASALKLILINKNIKINLENIKSSEKYLHMTDFVIEECLRDNKFNIPIDFSSLSYPLALGIINGRVLIKNCFKKDPYQADSIFVDLLLNAGADLQFIDAGLLATNKFKLKPLEIDGRLCPDLIMTLVFVASKIEGRSRFRNLEILKYKESDRLSGILKLLALLKIDFEFLEHTNELIITGHHDLKPNFKIETERDHRMVMLGYLFLRSNSGGDLYNVDCIDKSFPNFLQLMNS